MKELRDTKYCYYPCRVTFIKMLTEGKDLF